MAQPEPEQPEPPRPMRVGDNGVAGIEIVLPNGAPRQRGRLREREGVIGGPASNDGLDMINPAPETKVFLACRPIDLRAGFNGLAAKVQQMIGESPFDGSLFIFRGKRGVTLRRFTGMATGLWLLAKRLEKGRFLWPPIVDGAMTLAPAQMAVLIEAMDGRRTVAPPPPSRPMLV